MLNKENPYFDCCYFFINFRLDTFKGVLLFPFLLFESPLFVFPWFLSKSRILGMIIWDFFVKLGKNSSG